MRLTTHLSLPRCPHCSKANPTLNRIFDPKETLSHENTNRRFWAAFLCTSCGGVVIAAAKPHPPTPQVAGEIIEIYPPPSTVDEDVPERARQYLSQAFESLHAPDGAVMLAASAVDAMMKQAGLTQGTLYQRIEAAAAQGLITDNMKQWAHQVRLDANDPRHADLKSPHHDPSSARRAVEFATALAQFMFVLPARVTRGIIAAGGQPPNDAGS